MHKLIIMWSHPRSMSTAMERVMRERGDLDCGHEPFMYDYYANRQVRQMPHFDIEDGRPLTYEDVRDSLLARAEAGPVFVKDMAYYVMPRILEDEEFLNRITHCFLIRDPAASIRSYFKLDPGVTSEEIGLQAQWQLFEALKMRGLAAPVVRAEDIRADTRAVVSRLWQEVGLEFRAEAFEWQQETPQDWGQVSGWHGDVSSSGAIRALTPEELADQRRAFDALASEHPHLAGFEAHHRPYYDRLSAQALTV